MAGIINLSSVALALALAFLSVDARADLPRPPDPIVLSKGLRGRIGNAKLRPAKLVFTDTAVTVELDGYTSERFEYADLRIRRGQHPIRLPFLDKWFWLTTLPQVPLYFLTGPYYLAGSLGTANVIALARWISGRGTQYWLSLHSDNEQRRAYLVLPRKKKLRLAIFMELARRDKRGLRRRGLPTTRLHWKGVEALWKLTSVAQGR